MKALLIAAALTVAASPALATPPDCQSLEALSDYYASEYGETVQWIGMSGKDHDAIMILTAPDGSWSMIRVRGNRGCLIDFGLANTTTAQGARS